MDANGTRFHLLLGLPDWGRCLSPDGQPLRPLLEREGRVCGAGEPGLGWDKTRAEVTLCPRLFVFKAAPNDTPPRLDGRRGAARDRYGNMYWIDDAAQSIRVTSAGSETTTTFWATDAAPTPPWRPPGDFGPVEAAPTPAALPLSGLTITEEHYLVVGVRQPAGLLVFDLHAGGPPRRLWWPEGVPFVPFDMAPAPDGGVWILDRVGGRYWALDRRLNVIRLHAETATPVDDDFQPDGGDRRSRLPDIFPQAIHLDLSSPVAAFDPIAIEALPDGSVLILDRQPGLLPSRVLQYRLDQLVGVTVLDHSLMGADLDLVGHDLAFTATPNLPSDQVEGRVYVVSHLGNQSYAFDARTEGGVLRLTLRRDYWPMRLFSGKALVAAGQTVYYDIGERWTPLVDQRRPLYVTEGTLITFILDGKEPDCVWHRLMLDGCFPPETSVEVRSYASNERTLVEGVNLPWQAEPTPRRRSSGSELPFQPQAQGRDEGTWETLFQRARGRYLRLEVTLRGNGRVSPRLRALRAYYPRFSYLDHYLPAVYREESEPARFLDRFLANLEGMYTSIEDRIAAAQALFDVQSAPAETLDWLASWYGVALDPSWDEVRRRLFIHHALDFFQWRGTVRGLLMALRLAFECADDSIFTAPEGKAGRPTAIRIIEAYQGRRTPRLVLGDATDLTGVRLVQVARRWDPRQGSDNLNQRYSQALGSATPVVFPIHDPGGAQSALWQRFAQDTLGFVPSAGPEQRGLWQGFLARRYRQVSALRAAYGTTWTRFDQATLPTELPPDDSRLIDWYQFEAVVLASHATAHRFTVLLPVPPTLRLNEAELARRRDLADRLIKLEKPAHTLFNVQFYWNMFRVGAARLGVDTTLDVGSRAPHLLTPMILGQGYVLESYLAPGHPQDVTNRPVVGRDRLTE